MVENQSPSEIRSSLYVQSLAKAFEVLTCFTQDRSPLSFTDVVTKTGLGKSSVQRILHTLQVLGYLTRDSRGKYYRLSPKSLEFAASYIATDPLMTVAQPFLVTLRERTGETTNLAIWDDTDIVIAARLPALDVVSLDVQIGVRLPALYTASGLSILAQRDDEEVLDIFERSHENMPSHLNRLSSGQVFEFINACRAEGFCVTRSLIYPEEISIASQISASSGEVIAAISMSAPIARVSLDKAQDYAYPIQDAARKITSALRSLEM